MTCTGVVAHIERHAMANALAKEVKAAAMSVDDGSLGAVTNHRFVWNTLATEGDEWAVVLEDDAVPVPGFLDQLEAALAAAPTSVVSLYLGRQRPPQWQARIATALEKAEANGAHWVVGDYLLHAVATCIRTDLVPDMLAGLPAYLPIDQAIGRWARRAQQLVGYTVPSLVEHRDGPTLIRHLDGKPRPPGRVAWQVGTRDHWHSETVEL